MLLYSCAVAVLVFLLLSTRIWMIPIAGCREIPEQVIARALRGQGIYPGASRRGLVLYRIADMVRLYDDRIALIELDLDGIVCRVNVLESVKTGEPVDRSVPSDVVASKGGVITQIEPFNGRALVAVGQPVAEGDVLIAGDITLPDAEETLLVHAYGNVKALVTYSAEAAVPQSYQGLASSGRTEPYRRVTVAGVPMFETEPSFEHYVLTDVLTGSPLGTLLPVRVTTGTIVEQTKQTLSRPIEECVALALADAERRVYEKLPKDGAIADKQATYILHDGAVVGICSIAMEESIGYIKEIQIDTDESNGTDRN